MGAYSEFTHNSEGGGRMTEIEYEITQVYREHGAFVIESNTSWYGRLTFCEEDFNKMGRPTAGDRLILSLRLSKPKANKNE